MSDERVVGGPVPAEVLTQILGVERAAMVTSAKWRCDGQVIAELPDMSVCLPPDAQPLFGEEAFAAVDAVLGPEKASQAIGVWRSHPKALHVTYAPTPGARCCIVGEVAPDDPQFRTRVTRVLVEAAEANVRQVFIAAGHADLIIQRPDIFRDLVLEHLQSWWRKTPEDEKPAP